VLSIAKSHIYRLLSGTWAVLCGNNVCAVMQRYKHTMCMHFERDMFENVFICEIKRRSITVIAFVVHTSIQNLL
jgi:hypothetical protein